jgi:hypothetical protein
MLIAILIVGLISCCALDATIKAKKLSQNSGVENEPSRDTKARTAAQESQPKVSVPCQFPDPLNPSQDRQELLAYYERRTRGYANDIPIEEAVAQFNLDAQCNDIGKNQPPLTITELLAAVSDAPSQENALPHSRLAIFQRMANTKYLPKGSLIWYEWGHNQPDAEITYWKIYLYIELDKHPLDEKLDKKHPLLPNRLLVRKQYISVSPVKANN